MHFRSSFKRDIDLLLRNLVIFELQLIDLFPVKERGSGSGARGSIPESHS